MSKIETSVEVNTVSLVFFVIRFVLVRNYFLVVTRVERCPQPPDNKIKNTAISQLSISQRETDQSFLNSYWFGRVYVEIQTSKIRSVLSNFERFSRILISNYIRNLAIRLGVCIIFIFVINNNIFVHTFSRNINLNCHVLSIYYNFLLLSTYFYYWPELYNLLQLVGHKNVNVPYLRPMYRMQLHRCIATVWCWRDNDTGIWPVLARRS